jgi:large subunit ribosomal protein L34
MLLGPAGASLTSRPPRPYRCQVCAVVARPVRAVAVARLPTFAGALTDGVRTVSKRTFQPNNRRRAKTHGFRLRMRTRAGRAIIGNRRRKGRGELSA